MADCIIPEGYKKTSLGVIPKEWEVKRLGDLLLRCANGLTYDVSMTHGISVTCIETISTGKINYQKVGYIPNEIGYENFKMEQGDILYSHINSLSQIGKVAYYNGDKKLYHGMNLLLLRANMYVSQQYLYYVLLTEYMRHMAQIIAKPAVNQASISTGDLKKIRILVPPLEEQQKISEVLSVWDKAIEKQTQLIEKLELRKKGLMQQLLTGKKRLPGFSGEWKKVKLGDAAIFLSTNSFSREQLNSVKGNILNIHYGDVLVRYSSVLDASKEDIPYINEQIEYSPKDYINNGDVIMADTAEDEMVGRCCEVININNIKVVSGLHTILIHPIIQFAPKYLGYYLNSERYHKQIISIMQGIKVYSITKDALKNTTIDIPCIEEQAAIANILSLCDHEILLAKQKLSKFQWQKKGLMQVLLTGKKRIINNYGKY